ncbi:FadR/GntR family transcriptional regulator [Gordonia sihwensis]|uniref:FadR/GntR family transcriptional regulator n=1 Tax=Gordonia sihwensis TaxID=173559 RepID=UPI0005EDD13D|nr:FadR/GntR family transcriptional regulator [Gordonia sihwensis]KJR06109.1 GntR family transcriptional regulator [Gordonia sihwensis]MBY4570793.1 GntR family transcriptional regulator [Gordonia sihwensis]
MPAQVRRTPLADQAAEVLLERIRAGEWTLGQKLPGESTLAVQLGVGRSTVREAVRQLAGRGVLSSRQGAGVFVAAVDVPENWDDVLRRADVVAVLEARTAIETEAAALAARRRTPAQVRAMRAALEKREQSRSGIEDRVAADIDFHRAVVSAAGNPVLTELFDAMTPRVRVAMVDLLRIRREFDTDIDHRAHADIVDAVAARRPADAATAARTHLDGLKEALA